MPRHSHFPTRPTQPPIKETKEKQKYMADSSLGLTPPPPPPEDSYSSVLTYPSFSPSCFFSFFSSSSSFLLQFALSPPSFLLSSFASPSHRFVLPSSAFVRLLLLLLLPYLCFCWASPSLDPALFESGPSSPQWLPNKMSQTEERKI